MNRSEHSDYKSTVQDVVPSTRFGQGELSLLNGSLQQKNRDLFFRVSFIILFETTQKM